MYFLQHKLWNLVGSSLLESAENKLKMKGYQFVSLFVENEELMEYYLKKGYEIESKNKFQLLSKEL